MNSNPGRKVHFLSLSTTARRLLLALSCATLGLIQLGCASTPEGEPVHGKDRVLSFVAAKDGRKVAIAGDSYHYVFDGDPSVAALLRWEGRGKVTPALIGELKVARNQSFEGQYMLIAFDADLSGAATKATPTPLVYADDGSMLLAGVPVRVVQGGADHSCRAGLMGMCFYK
jgi:hypothetical protein